MGRKSNAVKYAVLIDPDDAEWAKAHGGLSVTIRRLLRQEREVDADEELWDRQFASSPRVFQRFSEEVAGAEDAGTIVKLDS